MVLNCDKIEHKKLFEESKLVGNCNINVHPSADIKIGKNVEFHNVYLLARDFASIHIEDNCVLRGTIIAEWYSKILIGKNLICNNTALVIRSAEAKTIKIGNNCLFADPNIYNSDYHGIYDPKTLQRTNFPEDVIIGDNVWLALRTIILKGANIGSNSVLGAGSVLHKGQYPNNSMLLGNPAKVVKSNILWKTKPTDTY